MDLQMNKNLIPFYNSESQRIRVMSELWAVENMFCPCCGNTHISKTMNNTAVADFICDNCGEIFELKSKKGAIGNKIVDGAYETMIKRIDSNKNPCLFIAQYSAEYAITDFILVPKFFFTKQVIEKRKPLLSGSVREGRTGCNILYSDIPEQGKIKIIQNGNIFSARDIVDTYSKIKRLNTTSIELRGWLIDVLNCVNDIKTIDFTLKDVYKYADYLKQEHIQNNNVEAKIRQQLQFLRDKGFIEFLGNGYYKKIL